jgi:hypothetical protein
LCLEAAKKDGHALDKAVVVSSGMKLKKTLKVRLAAVPHLRQDHLDHHSCGD